MSRHFPRRVFLGWFSSFATAGASSRLLVGMGSAQGRAQRGLAHGHTGLKTAVEKKVKQMIVEQLGVDEAKVTPNARLVEDLGADSLDVVELIMRLEEAFQIEIPDKDAKNIQTLKSATDYIQSRIKPSKAARVPR